MTDAHQRAREAALVCFSRRCLEGAWEGYDIDGGDIQDWATEFGLLVKTQYDPEKHGPNEFDLESGDDWYVFSDWMKAMIDGRDA